MQGWSIPLRIFSILKQTLPDVAPVDYMKHLNDIPYPIRDEIWWLTGYHNDKFEDAISQVFIKQRPGTSEILLKYVPTVQYGRMWNDFYRQCRGTVIDMDNMIAWHSFDKFFNIDEMPETSTDRILELTKSAPFNAYNKFDGSLVMFYCNGDWRTSTNGSFESEQAKWAMDFAKRTGLLKLLHADYTYMFEAIYPSNRIVVDYGDAERLVLLSVRNNETGEEELPSHWVVDSIRDNNMSILQILDARDKYKAAEKEGWVVYFPTLPLRIKIKCVDYVAVHRLKDQITPQGVFEMIRSDTLDDVRANVSDNSTRAELDAVVERFVEWERDLRRRVDAIHVDDVNDKKATYMAVREHFDNGTFEQWYALKCVRGEIDAQQSPLMYVTNYDKIAHAFEE